MRPVSLRYLRRNLKRLVKLFFANLRDFIWFVGCLRRWQNSAGAEWNAFDADFNICTSDRRSDAGTAKGHYFLQDLWAAQHVHKCRPATHIDVGSSIQGFVSHVASFMAVEYIDIRPLRSGVPNLVYRRGSILELPYESNSVESLSCLHVIEHIGLGRYGDSIDPDGWILGLKELERVLALGGQLLLSAPCGIPCVQFNAHRVFRPNQITEILKNLVLEEFSLIENDRSDSWISNCHPARADNLTFGCGLYRFRKPI
jgi:hypothetical protein